VNKERARLFSVNGGESTWLTMELSTVLRPLDEELDEVLLRVGVTAPSGIVEVGVFASSSEESVASDENRFRLEELESGEFVMVDDD
jgi:hypothetical protein